MNDQILLSSTQSTKLIGVTQRTWYSWDALGKIPKPIRIGKKLFWKRDELFAWIDANCPKRENWNYAKSVSKCTELNTQSQHHGAVVQVRNLSPKSATVYRQKKSL
ncbi:MAG: helix-turn-helix domain-containing protein [Planctomycetaceae bacterium]|nr:helix-turn-helix domain-containing protein [Planctomycetaceae bacterium]